MALAEEARERQPPRRLRRHDDHKSLARHLAARRWHRRGLLDQAAATLPAAAGRLRSTALAIASL